MKGEKVSQVRAKETSKHLHGSEYTDGKEREGAFACLCLASLGPTRLCSFLSICLTCWKVTRSPGSLHGLGLLLCFGLFLEAVLQVSRNLTLLSHFLSLP